MIDIQGYSKKDEHQVMEIIQEVTYDWGEGWTELVREIYENENSCPFAVEKLVAKNSGGVIGTLAVKKEVCASVIYFLAIKKEYRG